MLDSEYRPDNYKSSKISIGATIKNPKMVRLVSDHRKTKKMCKHALKKLLFVKRDVPDRYKTQQMSYNVILEHDRMLKFVPDCYKNKKSVIKQLIILCIIIFPHCFKIQKCLMKLSTLTFLQYIFFLNTIRSKKYDIRLLVLVFLHLFFFLNDIKLKKCVTV